MHLCRSGAKYTTEVYVSQEFYRLNVEFLLQTASSFSYISYPMNTKQTKHTQTLFYTLLLIERNLSIFHLVDTTCLLNN